MREQSSREFAIEPLTLRFPGDLEDSFGADYASRSLSQFRFSIVLGILLYALFGILDALLIPRVQSMIWLIRFAIVCPYLAMVLALSFSARFRQVMQTMIGVTIVVIGMGIVAMTRIAYPPGSYYYYAGLLLVLTWAYTFSAARFIYATIASWIVVAAYEIVAFWLADTPTAVLISNNFFFLSANIIGMLASYLIELYKRRDFWQRRRLEEEQARSAALLRRLQTELTLASDIQASLLPPPTHSQPGIEVTCYSRPCLELGGDFYSYRAFSDGRFALGLGDISGKGVAAALLMASSLSLFNTALAQDLVPSERMVQFDRLLAPYTKQRRQNCAFCYIEWDRRELCVVNAGGIPPYIRRRDGAVAWPDVSGFALGQELGAATGYRSIQLPLDPGDIVVLVSDGVVEARDERDTMFGFARLEQAIARGPASSAQAMLDHVVREVGGFVGAAELHDDCTIAVLRLAA